MIIIKKITCNACGCVHKDVLSSDGKVMCRECHKWIDEGMTKPEPLKGKQKEFGSALPKSERIQYHESIDIKSAVEWYKIYRNNPHQLLKDYPKLRDEVLEQLIFNTYNNWLLDKAFEDVMKKWQNQTQYGKGI